MSIVNSVLGVFVVLGIISHPAQNLLSNKDNQSATVTDSTTTDGALEVKTQDIVAKSAKNSTKNEVFSQNLNSSTTNTRVLKEENSSGLSLNLNDLQSSIGLTVNENCSNADTYGNTSINDDVALSDININKAYTNDTSTRSLSLGNNILNNSSNGEFGGTNYMNGSPIQKEIGNSIQSGKISNFDNQSQVASSTVNTPHIINGVEVKNYLSGEIKNSSGGVEQDNKSDSADS